MEQLYERLEKIGIDEKTVETIQDNDDEESALLLIALFDDRHEYVV